MCIYISYIYIYILYILYIRYILYIQYVLYVRYILYILYIYIYMATCHFKCMGKPRLSPYISGPGSHGPRPMGLGPMGPGPCARIPWDPAYGPGPWARSMDLAHGFGLNGHVRGPQNGSKNCLPNTLSDFGTLIGTRPYIYIYIIYIYIYIMGA